MFEKSFETISVHEKYPVDYVGATEAVQIELAMTNKERRGIYELCEDEYPETTNQINNCVHKVGFKKTLLSPFYKSFHVIPTIQENTCYVPIKKIPRLDNLRIIFPKLFAFGIEMIARHERQHCLSKALKASGNILNKNLVGSSYESALESQTNLQSANEIFKEERSGIFEGNEEINIFLERVVMEYIVLCVSKFGTEFFEDKGDSSNLLRWIAKSHNHINENKYDTLKVKFNEIKDELLKKYANYIEENEIQDFYNDEDRECEELRISAIDYLNDKSN